MAKGEFSTSSQPGKTKIGCIIGLYESGIVNARGGLTIWHFKTAYSPASQTGKRRASAMNMDTNQDFIKQMISQFGDAGLNYPGKTATLRVVPIVENEVVEGHAIFVLRGEDPVYFTQIPPISNLDKYVAQFKQAIDTVDNEMFVKTTQQIKEAVDAYIAENK